MLTLVSADQQTLFRFALADGTGYDAASHESSSSWTDQAVIGGKAYREFLGSELDKRGLSGVYFGNNFIDKFQALYTLKDQGVVVYLVDGAGFDLGSFTIDDIKADASNIVDDGSALKTAFNISFTEYFDYERSASSDVAETGASQAS